MYTSEGQSLILSYLVYHWQLTFYAIVVCRHSVTRRWQTMSWRSRRQSLQRTRTWRYQQQQKRSYWWSRHSEMHRTTRRKFSVLYILLLLEFCWLLWRFLNCHIGWQHNCVVTLSVKCTGSWIIWISYQRYLGNGADGDAVSMEVYVISHYFYYSLHHNFVTLLGEF